MCRQTPKALDVDGVNLIFLSHSGQVSIIAGDGWLHVSWITILDIGLEGICSDAPVKVP